MKLEEIPYLTCVPQDGRALLFQPWYDPSSGEWHMYFDIGPDNFIRGQVHGMSSGTYYATKPANEQDLDFALGGLITQHLSFPPVASAFYSLVDDIQLLSASLEKLEILRTAVNDHTLCSFLVETELEYLFVLVRSMYDLLQKISKRIGKLLCKPDGRPAIAELPDSFADVALAGDRPRTHSELATKYQLPDPLSAFYAQQGPLFLRIRDIRVSVEHHGKNLPTVFLTERGFGISTEGSPSWSSLEVWSRHELLSHRIGSVRALAAFLAKSFLDALTGFEQALRAVISPALLPQAVSQGNKLYLTNPSIHRLSNLENVVASPWDPPVDATTEAR
jgi:hypothetical protein